jgi:hypothetical protein
MGLPGAVWSYRMSISAQIRTSLTDCGEPMTVEQLSDANGWDREIRNQAYTLLGQMKKRGEIVMSLAEGKAHYALTTGYVAKRGRSPNPEKSGAKKRDRVLSTVVDPAEVLASNEAVEALANCAAESSTLFGKAFKAAAEAVPNHDELQQWSMQKAIERGEASKALALSDFDLQRRLDAIAADAEDALEDALKVGMKTEFLQQLHQASVAINRAARAYARN